VLVADTLPLKFILLTVDPKLLEEFRSCSAYAFKRHGCQTLCSSVQLSRTCMFSQSTSHHVSMVNINILFISLLHISTRLGHLHAVPTYERKLQSFEQNSFCATWLLSVDTVQYRSNV